MQQGIDCVYDMQPKDFSTQVAKTLSIAQEDYKNQNLLLYGKSMGKIAFKLCPELVHTFSVYLMVQWLAVFSVLAYFA